MGEADSYYQNEALRYFQEGYEKQSEGQIEEAIGLYQKSIEVFPTAEARTFLGWAYSFKGHYDWAIDECRKAIEIDPDYGNPYNDIGSYLIETGKPDDAIQWLQKATHAKRYESYCYPYYNLGRIWEAKGDWAQAIQNYERSLQANPQYKLAQRAINKIRGLMN